MVAEKQHRAGAEGGLSLACRHGGWLVTGLILIGCLGCQEAEGIRVYSVKRAKPSGRMLAAIVPMGEEAWFFKLTGPHESVSTLDEPFRKLIESLQFGPEPGGPPKWTLPTGWKQAPGDAMRFATLEIDSPAGPLQCTVSKLPVTKGQSLEDYLLANINRWRGQMRVAALTPDELPQGMTKITLADGNRPAMLVDIAGQLGAGGGGMGSMMGAPFASGGARPPMVGAGAGPAGDSPASPKVAVKAPTHWTPGELEISRGGIVVRREAVYEAKEGDQRVEITITKLPAAANATLPNINRWRGQIGMEALSPEQLAQETKKLEIGGKAADYVQFAGKDQTILGVILEHDGLSWFAKLQGHTELAGRERQAFEDFVKSMQFP